MGKLVLNTTISSVKSTSQDSQFQPLIYQREWWNGEYQWDTTHIVILILLIISICIIFATIGCIYYTLKTKKKKVPKKCNNSNIDSIGNIIKKNKYNELGSTDNEETSHEKYADSVVVENVMKEIEQSEESESESEFDSDELYGTTGTNATLTTVSDHQTPGSDINSTPRSALLMDKASIRSSIKASATTVGSAASASRPSFGSHLQSFGSRDSVDHDPTVPFDEHLYALNAEHQREVILEGEELVWDNWLTITLKELFPDNWEKTLHHFKQQKITQNVLISVNTDKQNKCEIWKELIPIIGDRIRFQKAWSDELLRQQLRKQT